MSVVVSLPTAEVRGWHGITARHQTLYRPEDWQTWAALGNDSARLVDVVPGSPAWHADLRNGAWITAIDGGPFDGFAGTVGQIVEVQALTPGLGPLVRKMVLAAPTPGKSRRVAAVRSDSSPAWKREPPVPPGTHVYQNSRPAFLEFVARHRHLKRRAWFLTELLRRDWRKGIIVKHKTIAAAVGCDIATVKRAQSCCVHFGVLRVTSGKGSRKHNTYEVCWPAGIGENGKPK